VNGRETQVSVYGLFGIGNLGNEGSLTAFVDYLRSAHPGAAVTCLSANPSVVKAEHALSGTTLMSPAGRSGSTAGAVRKLAGRLLDVPRSLHLAGQSEVVVVPGMGVFEETLGVRPWALPYWLFLMALACRLRGVAFAVVSVGVERPTNIATRWLFRWTLRLATYRSYRDQISRDAALAMGVNGAGDVRPDIAFALPRPQSVPVRPGHIAIGVMAYYGSLDDPVSGAETWQRYVEAMAQFVGDLIDAGSSVTLLVGDLVDRDTAAAVATRACEGRPDLEPGTLSVSAAASLEALMTEIATAEAVVASRFHNVICALSLAKPTVSLAYAPKNDALMRDFGLGGACQSLESLDVARLHSQLDEVRRRHPQRAAAMQRTVERYEAELQAQFVLLSESLLGEGTDRQKVMT
jgi:polysaccharide pyruvyl transferase WcaK-like protein